MKKRESIICKLRHSHQCSRTGLQVELACFSTNIPVLKSTEVKWTAKLGRQDGRGPRVLLRCLLKMSTDGNFPISSPVWIMHRFTIKYHPRKIPKGDIHKFQSFAS